MQFSVLTPLWGRQAIETFETTARSLLFRGNADALRRAGATYRIYTMPEDVATLRALPAMRKLEAEMPVVFETTVLDWERRSTRDVKFTSCFLDVLERGEPGEHGIFQVMADHCYSPRSFEHALSAISGGAKGLVTTNLSVDRAGFLKEFNTLDDGKATSFTLADMGLRHLSERLKFCYEDGQRFKRHSAHLYVAIGSDLVVVRTPELFLFYCNPQKSLDLRGEIVDPGFFDYRLASLLGLESADFQVMRDSREFICIDAGPYDRSWDDIVAMPSLDGKLGEMDAFYRTIAPRLVYANKVFQNIYFFRRESDRSTEALDEELAGNVALNRLRDYLAG